MDSNEMKEIVDEVLERGKEIFVCKDNCEEFRGKNQEKLLEIEKMITMLGTKQNAIIGILSVIGVPVLGIAIKLIFGIDT